ncbi:lytic murein transglycosylase [Comamonas sp. JUb58]|uniref:lytic murein transglycosylase n=1 Tax=Comamonas sp. JUb58 TaxID=2485114 RepID=UPI0010DC1D0A|nr:lytic murein transglycosylase [Comamonas sp. JUb58]TDS85315.1 lytic murein transglycosylase [Comamonas sp. JUb58]
MASRYIAWMMFRRPHPAMRQLATAVSLGLAACAVFAQTSAPQEPPNLSQAEFQSCLSELRSSKAFAAITPATFNQYTAQLQPDATVLPLLNRQPEFTMPVWDYIAVLVDEQRVAEGRAAYAKWKDTLDKIEQSTGVSPQIVIGVWGVESNFGQNLGGRSLVQSLGTLSCFGRRQAYFRGEFASALRILQEGHIAESKLVGSWAGAFGQTQFMPSTFFRSAVDFDGDGRRDIVDSVPDALASTAMFLKNAGYRPGQPWGFEVKLPSGFSTADAGRKNKKPLDFWRSAGVTLANGDPLPDSLPSAGLMIPAAGGPAFLVGRNFDALYSYNASENYGLAIAQLSNLVADSKQSQISFVTPWPTDDLGLSRAQNKELQQALLTRGYAIGEPDGMIGAKTREAIKSEQNRLGMKTDGRAGQKLLRALSN